MDHMLIDVKNFGPGLYWRFSNKARPEYILAPVKDRAKGGGG